MKDTNTLDDNEGEAQASNLDSESSASTEASEGRQEVQVVPLREKILVGMGGMTMFHGNTTVKATAMPFFNMILGVNPALLGLALAIPRIWDCLLYTSPSPRDRG